ncbi:hypothetical protein LLH03_16915 [bacterium]|nr:hypothetical protein [bacterium]
MACLLVLLGAALLLASPARAQTATFRVLRQGATWVAFQWDSVATVHQISYRERQKGRRLGSWRQTGKLTGYAYSVINLKPSTTYEFVLHPQAAPGEAAPADLRPVALRATTSPEEPMTVAGLQLHPPRQLGDSQVATTCACLEAYEGRLYVLEVRGKELWLTQVDPTHLKVVWSSQLLFPVDDTPPELGGADLCVFDDKLWMTWEVCPTGADAADATQWRQRLAYYDLGGDNNKPEPSRLSALMQIEPPRVAGRRGIRGGSLAPFLDQLWVSWTETYQDAAGRPRSRLWVGAYDPRQGMVPDPIPWMSCPTAFPQSPSIARFQGDLLLLFTDGEAVEKAPGSGPLMAARFDGKRFYDSRVLRRLGTNLCGRGIQYFDRFYLLYQSDANYPAAGGAFFDLALGRLPAQTAGVDPGRDAFLSAIPYVADMKQNRSPDVTALDDSLYAVWAKLDGPTAPGSTPRFLGTWLGKVTWSALSPEES